MSYLTSVAAGLRTDAILSGQKQKLEAQLQEIKAQQEAFRSLRPRLDDVRHACDQLLKQWELQRRVDPANGQQEWLWRLLDDRFFQEDLYHWLRAGGLPEEADHIKDRMVQRLEAALDPGLAPEQVNGLAEAMFDAVEKSILSDPVLANWRHQLSLDYLREQVENLQRLAQEHAGIYSQSQKDKALQQYAAKALNAWDIIDLSGLPEGDRNLATQKLLLRQLYMALRLAFEAVDPDRNEAGLLAELEENRLAARLRQAGRVVGARPLASPTSTGGVALGDRLCDAQRLVVLGDPGGGKTTLLRWLATVYLLRFQSDAAAINAANAIPDSATLPQQNWVPVLLRCRDFHPSDLCRSFTDFLAVHLDKTELLPTEAKVMCAVVLERIAKGGVLLLVDGLDEITDEKTRVLFCQELERTAIRYPDTPIVVTSRMVGYRSMPYRIRSGFQHGVICDLQPEDKDLFARRWVQATEKHKTTAAMASSERQLVEALHSSDRIERLTANPMLLTTMALVKRKVGKLPTRRHKLYSEAVAVLLNWNSQVYEPIEDDVALPQLAYLAYEMCRRGVQSITGGELLELLERFRENYPNLNAVREYYREKGSGRAFLNHLEARAGILMRSGEAWQDQGSFAKSIWEFRHLTFQEYLASVALRDGRYSDRDRSKTLAQQVAPLAGALGHGDTTGSSGSGPDQTLPDRWRESLRLLVSVCQDDDVDAVLLSILECGVGEEAATTGRARIVLAAQCLAEEPNLSEAVAQQILAAFVELVAASEGLGESRANVERTALEIWASRWADSLQHALIQAFCQRPGASGTNCGGLLAQLLGLRASAPSAVAEAWSSDCLVNLHSADPQAVIAAAFLVLHAGQQGWPCQLEGLAEALLAVIARGGPEAHAASWALLWWPADPASAGGSPRAAISTPPSPSLQRHLEAGAMAPRWQPAETELPVLVNALEAAGADRPEFKVQLIELLGRASTPAVLQPLLAQVPDQAPSVRAAVGAALLSWLTRQGLPRSPGLLQALEDQVWQHIVSNTALPLSERADGMLVLALYGLGAKLNACLAEAKGPVELRQRAAAGLGLVASRCPAAPRAELMRVLEQHLRCDALDLLIRDEVDWAEHDARLPVLQGASRGLQLAASADLPLLGSGRGRKVPMLTLTALQEGDALRIRTEVVTPAVWRLPLPAGEQLELVAIPGDDDTSGSPTQDDSLDVDASLRERCLAPQTGKPLNVEAQRTVRPERFALVRHPITQAQWQAVAMLPRLELELNPTPGSYKPDDLWERFAQPGALPVESVSWFDCQEWLRRLNRWLVEQWSEQGGEGAAPQLALPGEGQWEVACRAGATTPSPFHFGDTLDASWANYNGGYIYGSGRKGAYRQRPVPVGFFGLVNRWGLAELHGQLWELCGDQWHPDPTGEGWPSAGQPWEGVDPALEALGTAQKEWRLLRGGCWFNVPLFCRSAYRYSYHPGNLSGNVGFRVCCLPPGSLLGS
ncbi:MAG: SUMF1/EgtB/PvdO family nonheme iron enzyme [Synechococcaceae cyanobacterium]